MKNENNLSRRDFVRSASLVSAGLAGAATIKSCSDAEKINGPAGIPLDQFQGKGYDPSSGVAGLLFSQVGYEPGMPVRIIVRLPGPSLMSDNAICRVIPDGMGESIKAPCTYWGEVWNSHWWVAEFDPGLAEGTWSVVILDGGDEVFASEGLRVRRNILWDSTIELSAVDLLERRSKFSQCPAGWQDAGTLWVESCSQSAMVIALCELLEQSSGKLTGDLVPRLHKQITVGCDYLVLTQEKAEELGYPAGAISHDLHGHEHDILPHDVMKAVIALYRAVRNLPDSFGKKKQQYRAAADRSFRWLTQTAKPMGRHGMQLFQRGISEDTPIPTDEWPTRQVLQMCWASLEKFITTGDEEGREGCITSARELMRRQITKEKAENGYYGHFVEFPSLSHSENAWVHGIANGKFGSDIGEFYPNYLVPVIQMLKLWGDHQDAGDWRNMLEQFTNGFFKPACAGNPFYLVPLGIFGEEGPIWFCGTFHGTNAIYGFTAALAFDLADLLDDDELKKIAYGNLQWVSGLNGGLTLQNMELGCVVFSTDVPEGVALPVSMICGIGSRWGGTWFQTRGSICNGFSTGEQFVYDVAPVKENDGPNSLTDEDWIPHSAAWLTGMTRLYAHLDKGNVSH